MSVSDQFFFFGQLVRICSGFRYSGCSIVAHNSIFTVDDVRVVIQPELASDLLVLSLHSFIGLSNLRCNQAQAKNDP